MIYTIATTASHWWSINYWWCWLVSDHSNSVLSVIVTMVTVPTVLIRSWHGNRNIVKRPSSTLGYWREVNMKNCVRLAAQWGQLIVIWWTTIGIRGILCRNFRMAKKVGYQQFRKQYFQKWSKGLASGHCCSVILRLYFWKHLTVFKIFVNFFVIQKFLCIQYIIAIGALGQLMPFNCLYQYVTTM